jgi:LmbE family N-acetylglucosaminyl deacetylase
MQITDAAVFYAKLTKWDGHFDDLPVHAITGQLYYSLGFQSLHLPPSAGHFVVDISDTLEKKMASIACYQTQFPPAKAYVLDRVRAAALHFGTSAGVAAGELFLTTRTLSTRDPLKFLLGGG